MDNLKFIVPDFFTFADWFKKSNFTPVENGEYIYRHPESMEIFSIDEIYLEIYLNQTQYGFIRF